ncbi:MAG: hypothetical protein JXA25_16375 [Anaerolineales bacterium]|nr:hypothetical protein [Anaerolineales bacterium]
MTTMHISPRAQELPFGLDRLFSQLRFRLSLRNISLFGVIIVVALIAFELFNFSTTEFALNDLLGNLTFIGLRWSTILALAFCGMDFAGIAKLLTFDNKKTHSFEIWYLLGAWLLAATMNAMLSWWSVSLALISHEGLGNEVLGRDVLISTVPFFVAALVVLLRILIIGTLTLSGTSIFLNRTDTPEKPAADREIKSNTGFGSNGAQTRDQRKNYPSAPGASRLPTRSPMTARAAHRR